MEGGRDGADALREPIDEVVGLVVVAAGERVDLRPGPQIELAVTGERERWTFTQLAKMNSMRARPTPSLGSMAVEKACSGLPTLSIICVRGRANFARSTSSTSNFKAPR